MQLSAICNQYAVVGSDRRQVTNVEVEDQQVAALAPKKIVEDDVQKIIPVSKRVVVIGAGTLLTSGTYDHQAIISGDLGQTRLSKLLDGFDAEPGSTVSEAAEQAFNHLDQEVHRLRDFDEAAYARSCYQCRVIGFDEGSSNSHIVEFDLPNRNLKELIAASNTPLTSPEFNNYGDEDARELGTALLISLLSRQPINHPLGFLSTQAMDLLQQTGRNQFTEKYSPDLSTNPKTFARKIANNMGTSIMVAGKILEINPQSDETPSIGIDTDVAIITPDEGITWKISSGKHSL